MPDIKEIEKETVRISVRNLVEFMLRCGDLDNRRNSFDREAMNKGSRIHRKIQKSMGSAYRAEVSLKRISEYPDVSILVEGRADGVFEEDVIWIEEIKGIAGDLEALPEPVSVHEAQAKCYAFIYAEEQGLDSIGVQMTYVNFDNESMKKFRRMYPFEELKVWYEQLLRDYYRWVSFRQNWIHERNRSMEELHFPFPYREGQKRVVSSVYHTITERKQLFVQAPTGVGKTMSVVYPSVRAMGEGAGDVIFYLTAKTITRTVAEEAFQILVSEGLHFKYVTLTAKEKVCLCEEMECNPEKCQYAEGHFDRVNEAVFELLSGDYSYDRESLREFAAKKRVCPFEMTLDLCVWTDAVICDYNYVFDPNVYLKRFFGEGVSGNYIFLIDEAHNLAERSRKMYSASLYRNHVLEARKEVRERYPVLYRKLGTINRRLRELEKEFSEYQIFDDPDLIVLSLMNVKNEMDLLLEKNPDAAGSFQDFYFEVFHFLNICELLDENYVIYAEKDDDGKCVFHLFCVNPAENLGKRLEKGRTAIFFSATLFPMQFYRKLLSRRDDDYGIYITSPFPEENRLVLIGTDVSSRFQRRGYEEYRKIAEYAARTVWQKPGNYMIFFPSHKMLEDVFSIYEELFSVSWVRCICQEREMNEQQREEFLQEFKKNDQTLLAFCIMGGLFSEGIDLIGDQLIGAVIVGTGLPQISNER